MSAPFPKPRLFTLILLSALAILPINFFLPSLPGMAAEFGVDYGVMSLSLAAYAGVSACLQLVVGPLSDRFGRRPVILWAVAIFLAATLGCALAPDAGTFLGCRMLQAAIAPTYAISLATIRDTASRDGAAGQFGTLAMAWAIAPMLGPALGGLIDQALGWRACFYALALIGGGVWLLCWFDFGETNTARASGPGNPYGAFGALLGSAHFWAYCLCSAFSVGAFYAFLAGAPLAAAAFELSPAVLGMVMGSITGGFILGSFLAGRLAGRWPGTTIILAGRTLACLGLCLGLALHAAGLTHILALFGPCLFVGLSNGLTQPSASAGAISVLPARTGSAAGLSGAISVAGASLVSALAGAVLTPANAQAGLLLVMLASATLALLAALTLRHLERPAPEG
ncbi:MAG: Bcr/CflA family efflux MFS transporter [Devosia sp.]|uniref:Bcr/CflA family efflux MFS transporter n=1 Tax=Devosia sp. TaxID=1871048 RepID=UPI0024CADF2E|nr:Bcr/CflA family efflux MFS transporter [Devosia sp.]UYN98591.1 MAG: Bcr/CflA family efflux MFS transporter [Devosia sp.]